MLEEPRRNGLARRYAEALHRGPVVTFLSAVIGGFAVLAALSIGLGLLVTNVLLDSGVLEREDERLPAWLAAHRTKEVLDASIVGSILAGGVVLPIVVGVVGLALAALRHWRVAAFVVFALPLESGTYRATTLAVHRDRPAVDRLESLPVDASYPSGHTAASIAVYCGLALLLTSRIRSLPARIAIWAIAGAIPLYVAFARMARGMHHPIDCAAGAAIGIAALCVMVFASRAAGHAAELRDRREAR